MSDRVLADLGPDAPEVVYLCTDDDVIVVVNSHVAEAAG